MLISLLFFSIFSASPIQWGMEISINFCNEFPKDKSLLVCIHAKDMQYIYLDNYVITKNTLQKNRYIIPNTNNLKHLKLNEYYFIKCIKKRFYTEEVRFNERSKLTKQFLTFFQTRKSKWQKIALSRLTKSIDKKNIYWGESTPSKPFYYLDQKNEIILVSIVLFNQDISDKRRLPVGIRLIGYGLYSFSNKINIAYRIAWEVVWYD